MKLHKVNQLIEKLLVYGEENNLLGEWDSVQARNEIRDILKIKEAPAEEFKTYTEDEIPEEPQPILDGLLEYAVEKSIINDTITEKDQLDTEIMGALTPRQSEIAERFYTTANNIAIKAAADQYYEFAQKSNYIRKSRIDKNLNWKSETEYGQLEITINLAKPEKDPAEIAAAEKYGFNRQTKLKNLDDEIIDIILYGTDEKVTFPYTNRFGKTRDHTTKFKGVVGYLKKRLNESDSPGTHKRMERYMDEIPCKVCGGQRLKPEVLAVTIGGLSIAEFTSFSIKDAYDFLEDVELNERRAYIGKEILKEVKARLSFLIDVGLEYLTLDRSAGTLSGGEAQRIRLATQIGSGLVGVLYILDEPSIGLHQRDNNRLINTLEHIRDLGNTVIVVEHDEETIKAADYIIDIGPGAGKHGGEIVAEGSLEDILAEEKSLTGKYLSGKEKIDVPKERYQTNGNWLTVKGARQHNLKNIDVDIPIGTFTCITGVSGSGKSTLVNNILKRELMKEIYDSTLHPGDHDGIEGIEKIDKVIDIDQSPIGRTPRSNPVTYTKVFDYIRKVFASTPEAKQRGYEVGRFSFNVKGGRCEACKGQGIEQIEMHFLPDVYVPCDVCGGKRYNRETLEIKYKGKTIADVLDMNVEEALEFFENIEPIKRRLQTLYDVGLGYIRLGQPATTLSGGEAQRVKISKELGKRSTGQTLYLLDEPTTGLHFDDVKKLLEVLHRLRGDGNTVVVIEHNLDVIKSADYIIDLGPEGGEKGGQLIAKGTPEDVAGIEGSYTGKFLREML